MVKRLGGRKAAMALLALISGVVIDLATERGLSENLMYLMMAILGSYSAANVVAKGKISEILETATNSAPAIDNSAVVEALQKSQNEHEEYLKSVMQAVSDLQNQVAQNNKRVSAILQNKAE